MMMKIMILLLSLIPSMSYAHNYAEHGIAANILHAIVSPHHFLVGLLLVIVGLSLVKVFFSKK